MATLIGNTGSAVTATVETLTSTNTGATVEVNTGVKVIRVPSGVTVSGGNSIGTSGLTVNGNGKAIVLQEGGNIVGGPGNTSNNYGGTGGQGAAAIGSNTTVKYIKTSGNIVGGGGGGGGPGKGAIAETFAQPPTWNAWPGINSSPMSAWAYNYAPSKQLAINSGAVSQMYNVRNSLNNFANSFKKSSISINPAVNGSDGSSGNPGGPGETGGGGIAGSNSTTAELRGTYQTNINTSLNNESIKYTNNSYNYKVTILYNGNAPNDRRYFNFNYQFGVTINKISVSLAQIYTYQQHRYDYGSVLEYETPSAFALNLFANSPNTPTNNVVYMNVNSGNYNAKIAANPGGPGGQPGNAYNTINTVSPFG